MTNIENKEVLEDLIVEFAHAAVRYAAKGNTDWLDDEANLAFVESKLKDDFGLTVIFEA